MQEKILESLKRKQDYVSGDYLSHRLGVSRQALWKHIQELRDVGYDIIAVPHLGYKLVSVPDRLFPDEISHGLATKYIGRKVYYFDVVSSTMNMAMELALKGAPEGSVVVAETQTKGRGRLGRTWVSHKYKGIYASLILRPQILPNATPVFTLMCAVSVCEAIKEVADLDAQIKWPNDILFQGKKLGGILTELNAEMDVTRFIVIGLGLNVNSDKKTEVPGATSLKEQKKEEVGRVLLFQEYLRRMEENYHLFNHEGTKPILDKWRQYSMTLGKRVKITCEKTHLEGEALDIDVDGGLLIRQDFGGVTKVMAGDITHCR